MEKQKKQLLLGTLLHDIGKFAVHSRKSGDGKDHAELGEEWLFRYADRLPPDVPAFARLHHARYFDEIRKSNLTLLVYHADNLSAAGNRRDKEGVFDHRGTPLASIFSRLSLTETSRSQVFLSLRSMSEEMIWPQSREQLNLKDEIYDGLLQLFTREFEQWLTRGSPIGALSVLLEKYWSTTPSETKQGWSDQETFPDISLYDHTKTSVAFAFALYQYFLEQEGDSFPVAIIPDLDRMQLDPEKPYFRLVGGDLSGVQHFIYTISSRGALKGLRGRSFFLELLTEHVAEELLLGMGLPRTNLIFAGGGHFYLLCQNTTPVQEIVDRVKEQVNRWLRRQFGLRLYLALKSVPATAHDLTTAVSQPWRKVGEELGKEKSLRFQHDLKELLTPQEPLLDSCAVCHRDDLQEQDLTPLRKDDENSPRACQFCRGLYEFGDDLAREKNYLVAQRLAGSPPQKSFQLPTRDGSLLTYRLFGNLGNHITLERGFVLNSWDLEDYARPTLVPLSYGSYVPRFEDLPEKARDKEREESPEIHASATASLAGLACASVGIERIAALRIDVDNMGKLLSRGFPNSSLSHLASFSRQLSLFFKYHLNGICAERIEAPLNLSGKPREGRGRQLGVVYSGGDDLFVIGAWDDVLEFAVDVQREFSRFTSNPEITISAGVVIQDPHFPLYHIANEAGTAEERAKIQGRNRLTLALFPDREDASYERQTRQTYTWQEMETAILPLLRDFLALGQYDDKERQFLLKPPKALIYRLFTLIDEWKREGRLYLPRMAYTLRRLKEAAERTHMQVEWGRIQQMLMTPDNMAQLRTVLTWLELLCRSGQET